jgi:UDPglucose 6-dehydrogenase
VKICVIGLGKLGSVVAAVYAEAGHAVTGFDVNLDLVEALTRGDAPFPEPQLQELLDASSGRLTVTGDAQSALSQAEATIIIVPTPSRDDGSFTNEYVISALMEVGKAIEGREHLVVIASTVSPGSCDGVLRQALERTSGRQIGPDLGLVYSPEFIALGSIVRDMQYPELVLIGASDDKAASRAQELFSSVVRSQPKYFPMSLASAEIAKLAVNTFVTTKISYANMIGELCEAIPTASAVEVLSAVGSDSRIGTKYLKPAVGYGGPCFPRDNRALKASAELVGVRVPIAEATDEVNRHQPQRIVDKVVSVAPSGSRIAILGIAYKPDTPVCEESQGVKVANLLVTLGFDVVAHDPQALASARFLLDQTVQLAPRLSDAIEGAACVIVMTPWDEYTGLGSSLTAEACVIDPWGIL